MEPTTQNTEADIQWFAQPVDVMVEQDNIKWLDTMKEMKRNDLISYAVFTYGIPESAAENTDRNGLIALVVMANKAGGGSSVRTSAYEYHDELKDVLDAIQFNPETETHYLYLVRGTGSAKQVWNKVNDTWAPLASYNLKYIAPPANKREMRRREEFERDEAFRAAQRAKIGSVDEGSQDPIPTRDTGISFEIIRPMLPKMNREQLLMTANQLGVEYQDVPSDDVNYLNNKALVEFIIGKVDGRAKVAQ